MLQKVLPVARDGLGKRRVPDEAGVRIREGRIAEYVIHMDVGVDDIADGFLRALSDRCQQRATDAYRAARIDDSHAAASHDEADIGDIIVSRRLEVQGLAKVNEDAGGDLLDLKPGGVGR